MACRTDYSLLEQLRGSRVYDSTTYRVRPFNRRNVPSEKEKRHEGHQGHEESSPSGLTAWERS